MRCPDCGKLIALAFPHHECKPASRKQVLVCDKCGAENWNLASEGKPHDPVSMFRVELPGSY